jgi:hypothetical protein
MNVEAASGRQLKDYSKRVRWGSATRVRRSRCRQRVEAPTGRSSSRGRRSRGLRLFTPPCSSSPSMQCARSCSAFAAGVPVWNVDGATVRKAGARTDDALLTGGPSPPSIALHPRVAAYSPMSGTSLPATRRVCGRASSSGSLGSQGPSARAPAHLHLACSPTPTRWRSGTLAFSSFT